MYPAEQRSCPLGGVLSRPSLPALWTLSVQPTYTPRVGVCARSVPSWAFPGPPWASSFARPASSCVAALLRLIPPLHSSARRGPRKALVAIEHTILSGFSTGS
jgi:hypothetical protein